jgi:uncharacterized protein YpiB (UPF0302 family)
MDKMSIIYKVLLELEAGMVLDEALLKFQTERLYRKIDDALKKGDEAAFLKLTDELKSLRAHEKHKIS